jgi:hypothetical protein
VIIPTVELPPATPLTLHVTAIFAVLITLAENICVPPAAIFAVIGDTATDTEDAEHLPVLAFAGAVVVAADALTATSAVSVLPASSVTVNRMVSDPLAGATTVAVEVFAPWIALLALLTFVQAYVTTLWLQAAALPAPDSATF